MKKIFICFLLVCTFAANCQISPLGGEFNLTPNGFFDNVTDQLGNKYKLADLRVGATAKLDNGSVSTSTLLCSPGFFDLYFETGCGMDSTSAVEIARRNVVCQVFQDISDFINSPLKNAGNTTRVKIWIRNINNLMIGPTQLNSIGALSRVMFIDPPAYSGGIVSVSGITDSELWKTIQSGKNCYSDTAGPFLSYYNGNGFYHATLSVNFNPSASNPSTTNIPWNIATNINAPLNTIDLYTNVLHEVTHLLGFNSLVTGPPSTAGYPIGSFYYTRYDRFLKEGLNSQSLITQAIGSCSNMYNYSFNSNLTLDAIRPPRTPINNCITDSTICATAVKYIGTSTVPVYTPNCFEAGSSLSHFEDQCIGAPNANILNNYFVMAERSGNGLTKRFLKPDEKNVLQDIGYSIKTTFGNNTTVLNSFVDYGGTVNTGINVVGLHDGITTSGLNGTYTYVGKATASEPIQITGILNNDYNAVAFECLEDTNSANGWLPTTLSATSGSASSTILFRSPVNGIHLLRYIPVSANGIRGNITYVYVYVDINTYICGEPESCNLVINGGFEQYSALPYNCSTPPGQINFACGWSSYNGNTPDYFREDATNIQLGIPCNTFGEQTSLNSNNKGYCGLFLVRDYFSYQYTSYLETIRTKLASPLLPNTKYSLTFYVSLAEKASGNNVKFQAYFSRDLLAGASIGEMPIANPNMLYTNTSFSSVSNGWERVILDITTGTVAGEQYLYIGGLKNVQYNLVTAAQLPTNCPNIIATAIPPQSSGTCYYYLDNVVLKKTTPTASFELPNQVCLSSPINNLSNYLCIPQNNGIFTASGNGITNVGGFYSFNPAAAGVGTHTIFYSYVQPPSTVPTVISNTITVVASYITPTFIQVAPACATSNIAPLPTISTNGISGIWTPALNNTATTTYTFTPNGSTCATTTKMTIEVVPVGSSTACPSTLCPGVLQFANPELNASIVYRANNWIRTLNNYSTAINQDITMKAGYYTAFISGTFIKAGSLLHVKPESCKPTARPAKPEEINQEVFSVDLRIFPNPTSDMFTVAANDEIASITIYSIDGKTFYSNNNVNLNVYELNANAYQSGMYLILIETKNGQKFQEKLIKR